MRLAMLNTLTAAAFLALAALVGPVAAQSGPAESPYLAEFLRRDGLDQRHALLEAEKRLLAGMDADGGVDRVGNRQRRLDDVEMPVGERVE